MSAPARLAIGALVLCCLVLAARHGAAGPVAAGGLVDDRGATYRLDRAAARRAHVALLDGDTRAAGFRFAPATTPAGREVFMAAVAAARPEARRLVDLVDGLVTVGFAVPPRAGAIGLTRFDGVDYDVTVDLDGVNARHGARGMSAVILHELGHVVDRALVPDDMIAALDAAIPTGERCRPGEPTGACASVEERFADTFAKWAMDDLGVYGTVGYRILPPVPLAAWGRPLAELGT